MTKIITWNVNSVHTRLPRLVALLARHQPDLVCLQEIKTTAEAFPASEVAAAGYQAVVHGQASRNGVAVLARVPVTDVVRGFAGDPVPEQARVLSVTADGLRVVCVYVVNGKEVSAPEYELKLRWLDAFTAWLRESHRPTDPLIVAGDFNITPDDRDVYAPDVWRGRNLASEPERARIRGLLDWGLTDLGRLNNEGPGPFTFWDYRAGAFHRGWGLRIDLALATAPVAARCTSVTVDRDERKPTFGEGKPSDHAPLIVRLRE
ncbi:MAG TPA: exodeoxyribonuclease III [Trebonia sp.]|nr:exodeoxyribonuclease III [Trebonia sp.]